MEHNYEEIVREWYLRLWPKFQRVMADRYSRLRLEDAENIYQDAFAEAQRSILEGRARENTNWSSYIIQIGLNLASHEIRKVERTSSIDDGYKDDEGELVSTTAIKVEKKMQELFGDGENVPLYRDSEAQAILGDELAHTPDPCGSIILLYYYEQMSMEDIAIRVGYKNASTAKSKKNQCMKDLARRVKESLRRAGLI